MASNFAWRLFLSMVPEGFGEREQAPRSLRFPAKIGKGIDEIAKATGQGFPDTTFFLLQWAITEWRAQRELEKKAARDSLSKKAE